MRGLKLTANEIRTLERFKTRAALALQVIRDTRRNDCPRCTSADCEVAMACTSRLDSDTEEHGFFDGPMCKHAPDEKRRQAEEEATKAREYRMQHAGVPDPTLIKMLAGVRVMPRVPRAWYGVEQQELRVGAEQIAEGVEAWLAYPDCHCLLLIGDVGTGKSTAAAWAVASTAANSLWLPARTVDDLERWKLVSSLAYSAELLVIDDIGTERQTESGFGVETLANLWVDRLDSCKRTLVTTNLSPQAIVNRYGDRLRSRLTRRPQVGFVEAGAVDLRRLKRDYEARVGAAKDFRSGR